MTDHPKDMQRRPIVLVAEDDKEMRQMLVQALRKDGYEVSECSNGFHMLGKLGNRLLEPEVLKCEAKEYDLIISDIRMPGVTGLSVLEGMRLFEGFPPMILITAFGDEETHAKAREFGAAAVFDKPFELEDLLAKVHEILAPVSHSRDCGCDGS
jgi:DNA-binding response OmpR family regulator